MQNKASALICSLTPLFLLIIIGIIINTISQQTGIQAVTENSGHLAMIISAVCSVAVTQKSSGKKLLKESLNIRNFRLIQAAAYIIAGYSFVRLIYFACGNLFSLFTAAKPSDDGIETTVQIICSIIVAPVCEEIIFRYCMIETTRKSFPLPLIIICNGLIFGIVHPYNIQGVIYAAAFGITSSLIYTKSKNLLYCIIVHMFSNLISNITDLLEYTITKGEPLFRIKNGFSTCSWIMIAVYMTALAAGIGLLVYAKRKRSADQ